MNVTEYTVYNDTNIPVVVSTPTVICTYIANSCVIHGIESITRTLLVEHTLHINTIPAGPELYIYIYMYAYKNIMGMHVTFKMRGHVCLHDMEMGRLQIGANYPHWM